MSGGRERNEEGQGSVEYVGIVLIVGAIVAANIGLLANKDFGIGEAIGNAVKGVIQKLADLD